MPKVKISEYSATANSNTDVASINIDEGCAPSGINNAIRAVMGHLKDFQQGTNGDPFNGPHNGTVGATTPATGAFTSLTASTTLGVTGVATFSAGTALLPAITTTGDTNTGIWFPAADTIAFTEGGVESMRINDAGDVGIGTPTPDIFSRGYGTIVGINDSGSSGAALEINSASSYPAIELGRGGVRKAFFTAQSTVTEFGNLEAVPLVFYTNSAERARFNSTGALVFAGGTTTADGIGITFPATQSASTNANTLDDYEEGTWTPATVNYTGSLTTITATYIKIGRLVTIQLYFGTSDDATSSGTFSITGLPFLSETSANNYSTFSTCNYNNPNATAISGAQIIPNSTSIRMLKKTLVTSPTWSDWIGSDVNLGEINMTFTYQSNS